MIALFQCISTMKISITVIENVMGICDNTFCQNEKHIFDKGYFNFDKCFFSRNYISEFIYFTNLCRFRKYHKIGLKFQKTISINKHLSKFQSNLNFKIFVH